MKAVDRRSDVPIAYRRRSTGAIRVAGTDNRDTRIVQRLSKRARATAATHSLDRFHLSERTARVREAAPTIIGTQRRRQRASARAREKRDRPPARRMLVEHGARGDSRAPVEDFSGVALARVKAAHSAAVMPR